MAERGIIEIPSTSGNGARDYFMAVDSNTGKTAQQLAGFWGLPRKMRKLLKNLNSMPKDLTMAQKITWYMWQETEIGKEQGNGYAILRQELWPESSNLSLVKLD